MGDRGEAGFERARRQVHATFQHQVEEAFEQIGIAAHHVVKGDDIVGTAEVQAEHATRLGGHKRDAGGVCTLLQAVQQARGVVGQ